MSKGTYIINHNGHILDGNKPAGQRGCAILPQNRAFRYGDSLFESICVRRGRIPLLSRHFERLEHSCAILKIRVPALWNETYFHQEIQKLVLAAGLEEGARIRLTVYRSGGGLYKPEEMSPEFLIEASPLPELAFSENPAGLNVSIYTENVKTPGRLAALKSGNALLYVLASIAAKEQEYDDMLLLNEGGNIVEATGSNLFYFHNGKLFTTPLSDGCVAGVMRRYLVENAEVTEKQASIFHLAEAEEIFLCNATLGIRPVAALKGQAYETTKTLELAKKIYRQLWA